MRVLSVQSDYYVSIFDLLGAGIITSKQAKDIQENSKIPNVIDDDTFEVIAYKAKRESDCDCDCAQEC